VVTRQIFIRVPPRKRSGFDVLSGEDVGGLWQERNRFKRAEFSLHVDPPDMVLESQLSQASLADISLQSIL